MDTEALNAQQAITIRSYREENKGLKAALADFVAAAEKAKGDLAAVGRSILDGEPYLYQYQLMVAIQDDLNDEALRARKVMEEEA